MRYMLDTNICIYLINHRPTHVRSRFDAHSVGEIGVSTITAMELAYGVERSGSARNRQALETFLLPLEIAPFDEAAIGHYARIRHQLEQRGTPIGPYDLQIAAHARALGCTLVTNNTRAFERVDDLLIENWAEQGVSEPPASYLGTSA
ncbi:type II toxin-antitoxin system VapC family toxin [Nitrogeniibacter mangrovi]|uniref:Ribonuclease VapC n=1 Tax=Nitrogeniibacter mangrovi TaxID=2016596 RepID=A0A6C1B5R7_9RHOO|nr:type II toxin-antitoxin system VapC family toxin [Nitrogeniibacter mangrovi]